jgi:hypothetical protein
MSETMNDLSEHWNMPWHAWLKSLAQTSKVAGATQMAAASDSAIPHPTLGSGGSWLIRARGRASSGAPL